LEQFLDFAQGSDGGAADEAFQTAPMKGADASRIRRCGGAQRDEQMSDLGVQDAMQQLLPWFWMKYMASDNTVG
jgi:hypothetical protein